MYQHTTQSCSLALLHLSLAFCVCVSEVCAISFPVVILLSFPEVQLTNLLPDRLDVANAGKSSSVM